VPRERRVVLVTGATGFVARGLVERLAKRFRVIGLARRKERIFAQANVGWVTADLRKPYSGKGLPKRLDHIIHVAAIPPSWPKQDPREIFGVNVLSTLDLLEIGKAKGIRSFVLVSTGAVYGFGNRPHREDSPVHPDSFYALTKWQAEELTKTYEAFFPSIVLRLFFPYGPGQVRNFIPSLIEKIAQGETVYRNSGGRPRINPIYISDAQRAMERALLLKQSTVFNIAGGETISVGELQRQIGELLPQQPRVTGSGKRVSDLLGDNSRMRRVLGVSPKVTLREGLRRTVEAWILSRVR
jgi:nucleoside-diphosphate-sugar epimerase